MNIESTEKNNAIVLSVVGRLDSNTSDTLNQHLTQIIETGHQKVIVDFSGLDYISSAGLRVLLLAAKQLRGKQAAFILCDMEAHIREVFEISGFLKILTVVDSLEEAQNLLEPLHH